jgi:hypothetical protein
MITKTCQNDTRLGYLLTEDDTQKVIAIMNHLGLPPHYFVDHCIKVLWEALNKNG